MNTSAKIRLYLQTQDSATVAQLCRALDLTKADIHYHMRLLLKEGRIEVLPDSYQSGAGRPARQYKVIKPAPEILSRLVINLLIDFEIHRRDDQNNSQKMAEFIATGILAQCRLFDPPTASPAIKLTKMINELSTFGIHLRWVAQKEGPLIYLEKEYLSTLIQDPALVDSILNFLFIQIQKQVA